MKTIVPTKTSISTKSRPHTSRRRSAALLAVVSLVLGVRAFAHESAPVTVDIYDRTQGETLATYAQDGQRYVVGVPGHEYAIRIRNHAPTRIVAITSVDGVNVVTGDTASPTQSGYVIDAGGSVEISGWRRSLEHTAAFYFTDLGDSYAARTDRPDNVGVIGVAVFHERRPLAAYAPADRAGRPARADAPESGSEARDATRDAAVASESGRGPEAVGRQLSSAKIGTGFGRDETSLAQQVTFNRATSSPAESITIRYDRRENLIAMGVLPNPRYAQRTPDPFPLTHFVPAPR